MPIADPAQYDTPRDFAWLQWQIDHVKAIGGNCVKILGISHTALTGSWTQADQFSLFQQVADYCNQQSVLLYPATDWDIYSGGDPLQAKIDFICALVELLDVYPNILGFDLLTEPNDMSQCAPIYNAAQPLTDRPITFGWPIVSSPDLTAQAAVIPNYCDFIDLHIYAQPDNVDWLDSVFLAYPNKEVFFGEFGTSVALWPPDVRASRIRAVMALANLPQVSGSLFWQLRDVRDFAYGMWAFDGTPVQEMINEFQWSQDGIIRLPGGVVDNSAQFVSQSVPLNGIAGQQFNFSVTMHNSGTTTWTSAKRYRMGDTIAPYNHWVPLTTDVNAARLLLAADVPPGADAIFQGVGTFPTAPGSYQMQWIMLQDTVQTFGPATPLSTISVAAGAPPSDLNSQIKQAVANLKTLTDQLA